MTGFALSVVEAADADDMVGEVAAAALPYCGDAPSTVFPGLVTFPVPQDDVLIEGEEPIEESAPVLSASEIVLDQYTRWEGVRYRMGGTDTRGVDCSALTQAIFKAGFQIELPRSSRSQVAVGKAVSRKDIRPGDLVYFIDRGRSHVGIALSKKKFVHASSREGVTISSFDGYWKRRLKRVRRVLPDEG